MAIDVSLIYIRSMQDGPSVRIHCNIYYIVNVAMEGSMVSFWWDSLAQATSEALLGVVVFYLVVIVVYRRGNSDKEMLGESVFLGRGYVIFIVGYMEVSRQQ